MLTVYFRWLKLGEMDLVLGCLFCNNRYRASFQVILLFVDSVLEPRLLISLRNPSLEGKSV